MKIPTIFFGSSTYVIPLIESLNKHFDLKLVITTEKKLTDAVISYCHKKSIPFLSTTSLKQATIVDELKNQKVEVAILASFGLIIPQEIIDIFPKGIINIHPSLLPEYRGTTPIQSALLDGKKQTGISIMLLDTEIDHGPLLTQESLPVTSTDTAGTLYEKSFQRGGEMLATLLPKYLSDAVTPVQQDHTKATYTPRHLTRESGHIDFESLPKDTENMIKAYSPWPGVWGYLHLHGKKLIVKLLPDQKIQVEGKNPMTIKDFINGYPEAKQLLEQLQLV